MDQKMIDLCYLERIEERNAVFKGIQNDEGPILLI